MNKLSKLTALLLAIVLALGVPMQVMAEGEEIETKTKYYEVADQILQAMIMSYQTYGEYRDMAILIEENDFVEFFEGLSEADQLAMVQYVNDRFWESCYSYTNVAKPMPAVTVESTPATFSLISRANTDSTDDPYANNGLEVDKNAVPNGDGTYTITMDSYVTGSVSTKTETTPLDVVMVLDVSGSMEWELDSSNDASSTESRLYELKVAVKSFLDSMAEGYDATTMDHRVDIIAYSGSSSGGTTIKTHTGWTPTTEANVTTLKSTVDGFSANGATYTDEAIALAETQLTPTPDGDYSYTGSNTNRKKVVILFTDGVPGNNTNENDLDRIADTINTAYDIKNDLGATIYTVCIFSGAKPETAVVTYPQDNNDDIDLINGMMHAVSSNYPTATAEYPVTATVTTTYEAGDFVPCTHERSYRQVGNRREEYCPEGCTFSYQRRSWGYTATTSVTISQQVDDQLKINYNALNPNASPHTDGASYYLSAGEKGELSTIFNNISNSIQQGLVNTQLGVSTVVKDVMTPYFDLPANASAVNVYTVDCVGFTDAGEPIWATTNGAEDRVKYADAIIKFGTTDSTGTTTNIVTGTPAEDNNTVWVEGFDYSGNYVVNLDHDDPLDKKDPEGDDKPFYGRKLVVEFVVEPTDGFLGGNNVVTNEKTSGIYKPSVDESGNPTGGYDSVEPFPEPDVDVDVPPLKIVGENQHIYLGNNASLDALLQSFSVYYDIVDDSGNFVSGRYQVDSILNYYTSLDFTLKIDVDKDGTIEDNEVFATYHIDAASKDGKWTYNNNVSDTLNWAFDTDTQFDISYIATSPEATNDDGTIDPAQTSDGSLTAWVYVYKPEVTFQDSVEKYMDTMVEATEAAYYEANNKLYSYSKTTSTDAEGNTTDTVTTEGVTWYHTATDGTKTEAGAQMSGFEPELTFAYTEVEDDEKDWLNSEKKVTAMEDVEVTVQTTVTGTGYPDGYVLTAEQITYYRNQGDGCPDTCDWTSGDESENNPAFVIHITDVMSSLTITKVCGTPANAEDTFIFTITGTDDNTNSVNMRVVLKAGESVTINNLLIGGYKVTEDLSWSWRYTLNSVEGQNGTPVVLVTKDSALIGATLSVDADGAGVTFTNSVTEHQWLDGSAYAENIFTDSGVTRVVD